MLPHHSRITESDAQSVQTIADLSVKKFHVGRPSGTFTNKPLIWHPDRIDGIALHAGK